MKNAKPAESASLGEIIDKLTAEARSDQERIWNFQQALQKHVSLPRDGFVVGEPVKLVSFNYNGNLRARGDRDLSPVGWSGIRSGGIRGSGANAHGRFAVSRSIPPMDGAGALSP
jgi:hypothetical protein